MDIQSSNVLFKYHDWSMIGDTQPLKMKKKGIGITQYHGLSSNIKSVHNNLHKT